MENLKKTYVDVATASEIAISKSKELKEIGDNILALSARIAEMNDRVMSMRMKYCAKERDVSAANMKAEALEDKLRNEVHAYVKATKADYDTAEFYRLCDETYSKIWSA